MHALPWGGGREEQGKVEVERCAVPRNHFIEERGRCYREVPREGGREEGGQVKAARGLISLFLPFATHRVSRGTENPPGNGASIFP